MPGLTDWFDVFRTGRHRDRLGVEHCITAADVDQAIKAYKAGTAPVVVGHPALNAPAFGWIDAFRRLGDRVQARCSQVVSEFADMVERGMYRNRSISFNSDGTFRHVGFLGAWPPAVKGLELIQFAESEGVTIMDVSNEALQETSLEPQEFAAGSNSQESVLPLAEPADAPTNYQELCRELEVRVLQLEGNIASEQAKSRKAEYGRFVDELVQNRLLAPQQKGLLVEFMEFLASAGNREFGEAEQPVLTVFTDLLKGMQEQFKRPKVEFGEFSQAAMAVNDVVAAPELARQARLMIDRAARSGQYLSASAAVNEVLRGGNHA